MQSPNPGRAKKISIVGLGYVGLPLAVSLADKYQVVGFDKNKSRIKELKEGTDRTLEVSDKRIRQCGVKFVDCADAMQGSDVFIVTVPTPITADNKPDLSMVAEACEAVGRTIGRGATFVLESTGLRASHRVRQTV